jgi:uncharacterized protein YecT (DUF1311 family)
MRLALTLAALAFAAPALAQDIDCKNAMTQMDINICAGKDYQAADKKLNKIYGKLMAAADATDKELLRKAERAWIAFRDAQCEYQASGSSGGSIHPMEVAGCYEALTEAHTKQLEQLIDCPEDTLNCKKLR